jgi:hypothetical protein
MLHAPCTCINQLIYLQSKSTRRGRSMRPLPKDAPVRAPTVSTLPSRAGSVNQRRSKLSYEERWRRTCKHRAQQWLNSTPQFILSGISLTHLAGRPKNSAKDKEIAAKTVLSMQNWAADSCSGRWYDENGNLLVAAFADHIEEVRSSLQIIECRANYYNSCLQMQR